MTDNLYVKMRGRVIGPFDEDRLIQMVRQGQLSRASSVSADGENWQKAGSITALFKQEKATANPTQKPESNGAESKLAQKWHYEVDAESHGPVSASTIHMLIVNGKIGPEETVWCEGMADWEPAGVVSEFAGFFPTKPSRDKLEIETSSKKTQSSSGGSLSETTRLTTASAPWVSFISIVTFIFAAIAFFGNLSKLIKGVQAKDKTEIAFAIASFVVVGAMIGAAVLLNRFAAGCKKFQYTSQPDDLNTALAWVNKFWVLAGIAMIMALIYFVIGMVFEFTTESTYF